MARALAKNREERYQSMDDLGRDLLALRASLGDQDIGQEPAMAPGDPLTSSDLEPTVLRESPAPLIRRTPTPRPTTTPTPRAGPTSSPRPPSAGVPPRTPTPAPAQSAQEAAPVSSAPWWQQRSGMAAIAVVVLLLGLVATIALWRGTQPEAGAQPAAAAPPSEAAEARQLQEHLSRGRDALRDDDYQTATAEARAALQISAGHADAQQLLKDAEEMREAVEAGTREAQKLFDAGRLEEATQAAGAVLGIAPNNAEARALVDRLSASAQRGTADEAMNRMVRARRQAEAAGARELVPDAFASAQKVEAEARRRFQANQFGEATTRFYESAGLYGTAAGAAGREAAQRKQRAAEAAQRRELEQRIATARDTFELRRREAEGAGAPTRAAERYTAALEQAVRAAQLRNGQSVREYEIAAEGMAEARRLAEDVAAREQQAARDQQAMREQAAARAASPPAQTQPAHQTPPPPSPAPEPPPEQGIRAALQQYASALENRDLAALKRVWPSLSGQAERDIRDDFQNAREISVGIDDERIDLNGDSATVTCLRHYLMQTRDGHRLERETRTIISLRRNGRSWLIDSIRFEQP